MSEATGSGRKGRLRRGAVVWLVASAACARPAPSQEDLSRVRGPTVELWAEHAGREWSISTAEFLDVSLTVLSAQRAGFRQACAECGRDLRRACAGRGGVPTSVAIMLVDESSGLERVAREGHELIDVRVLLMAERDRLPLERVREWARAPEQGVVLSDEMLGRIEALARINQRLVMSWWAASDHHLAEVVQALAEADALENADRHIQAATANTRGMAYDMLELVAAAKVGSGEDLGFRQRAVLAINVLVALAADEATQEAAREVLPSLPRFHAVEVTVDIDRDTLGRLLRIAAAFSAVEADLVCAASLEALHKLRPSRGTQGFADAVRTAMSRPRPRRSTSILNSMSLAGFHFPWTAPLSDDLTVNGFGWKVEADQPCAAEREVYLEVRGAPVIVR